ncbi:RQC domain protein [Alicyclobacillus curvatus]|nr:RQC domain protein [Alicyclobacillus curvatus]
MAKKQRVQFTLRPAASVSETEIKQILRAADDLIASGGRNLLAKMLKGSKEKKALELELDKSPSYGCFQSLSLDEVMEKIDWMIKHRYLEIEYDGRLPLLVFTEEGWNIEREELAHELLHEWDTWIDNRVEVLSMDYLKDRNRGMILLFLRKIEDTRNPKYIPLLEKWEQIDYKKVRQEIRRVVSQLQSYIDSGPSS